MKFGKRELNLLLVVAGILIGIVGYFVFYNDFNNKKEKVTNDCKPLESRMKQLRDFEANQPMYEKGIEDAVKTIADVVNWFPPMVRVEDSILYTLGIDDETNRFSIDGMGFYTYDLFDEEDPDHTDVGNLAHVSSLSFDTPTYLMSFSARPEPDMKTDINYSAFMLSTSLGIGNIWYNDLKDMIRFINNSPYRTFINTISMSYNSNTGMLSGTMQFTQVYLNDGAYEYIPTELPEMPEGVEYGIENPFMIER
ncbi:MAG: hypothetical protein LBC65_05840 [Oscillospiraceae bacterium]|jgi:hypothetical protein|nr:hypothetical protein [Oscillospiraceae bacterium]